MENLGLVGKRPRRVKSPAHAFRVLTPCHRFATARSVSSEALPRETLARLVRAAFGSSVRLTSVTLLRGDASTRRYARLTLDGDGPSSAVAMLLGEGRFTGGSDELGGGIAITELPFVNVGRWLAAAGFAIPALYADASREDGVLLLEDIGDTTLWAAASAEPARVMPLFEASVDLLVAFQTAGARTPDDGCYAFHRRFDRTLAEAELEHFVEHGVETRHGRRLPASERSALLAALRPLLGPFDVETPCLMHRDFMAWNLHLQGERLRLIDFQDALMGPEGYDLAALLTDRTTLELIDPSREAALLERFRRRRSEAGLAVADDLEARYRRLALHRALKVIGRFHFLEIVRGKPGYLAYLPAVYGAARRMLEADAELAPLRPLLARYVPELADGAAT